VPVPLSQKAASLQAMQFFAIVLLCVIAAVAYGVVHDQITVRVCLEYFTVNRASPVTKTPTRLSSPWGNPADVDR